MTQLTEANVSYDIEVEKVDGDQFVVRRAGEDQWRDSYDVDDAQDWLDQNPDSDGDIRPEASYIDKSELRSWFRVTFSEFENAASTIVENGTSTNIEVEKVDGDSFVYRNEGSGEGWDDRFEAEDVVESIATGTATGTVERIRYADGDSDGDVMLSSEGALRYFNRKHLLDYIEDNFGVTLDDVEDDVPEDIAELRERVESHFDVWGVQERWDKSSRSDISFFITESLDASDLQFVADLGGEFELESGHTGGSGWLNVAVRE